MRGVLDALDYIAEEEKIEVVSHVKKHFPEVFAEWESNQLKKNKRTDKNEPETPGI